MGRRFRPPACILHNARRMQHAQTQWKDDFNMQKLCTWGGGGIHDAFNADQGWGGGNLDAFNVYCTTRLKSLPPQSRPLTNEEWWQGGGSELLCSANFPVPRVNFSGSYRPLSFLQSPYCPSLAKPMPGRFWRACLGRACSPSWRNTGVGWKASNSPRNSTTSWRWWPPLPFR